MIKNPRERLILALDVASADEAKRLIERVEGEVEFVKIGLELFTAAGPSIVRWFIRQHFRVFLDLKLLDIGETVKRTTAVAAGLGVTFFTVHARSKILHAAVEGRGEAPMKILAITVLTNLAEADLREAGVTDSIPQSVLRRAHMAVECKADGVIASGVQTNIIRKELGRKLLIVTPGIRPSGTPHHDQVHPVTPAIALAGGADYLVVGRPIRDAEDPAKAAHEIQEEIAAVCANLRRH